MQKFLIIFGIIAVGYLAVTDTIQRFKELDIIAVSSTTPSQEEMKSELMKSKGKGVQDRYQNNLPEAQNFERPKYRTDNIKNQVQTVKEGIKQPKVPTNINPNK